MAAFDGQPIERRQLLNVLGTGTMIATAGCLGSSGAGDTDTRNKPNENERPTYKPNIDGHPGTKPITFTASQNCAICNMTPTDYPQWHSQLAHKDGTGAVFDTPGCMFAYIVATTSNSKIAGAWTVDFKTEQLIDATTAHFVLVTDAEAADDPMKINPRAFADYGNAVAYLDTWEAEELTEDDIVGLENVDQKIAEIYRGHRI